MNAQLETLLQIQDLKAQRREIQEAGARKVQEEEFNLDIEDAVRALDGKIEELEAELDPAVRRRYHRLAAPGDRAVVPAINGMCYGCFVSVATAIASDPRERDRLRSCDHCGRFLYFVG